ncbi:MAG: hypothetical protein IKC69_01070 [Clostridia bacterium]|nr:hypothetical protein [Clostridia bacterium]
MKLNQKSNKGLLVVVGIAVFLIPMLLAALFLQENLSPDLTRGTVQAVRLLHGEEEERITASGELAFFIEAATGGDRIEKAADDLEDYRLLTVTFEKFNREYTYRFYLSDSELNCVYTDPAGAFFLLPSETAKRLQGHALLEDYALSFSDAPVAVLSQGGKDFAPVLSEGEWNYLRADGEEHSDKVKRETETVTDLPQGESLNLKLSTEPDYCHVAVMRGGEQLFSDDYAKLPPLTLEQDTELTVIVTCSWYEKEETSYHGKITYTFDVFYNLPTLCTLDRTEVKAGETLTLTVAHSSTPQIDVTTGFAAGKKQTVKRDGNWIVTIPVAEDAMTGKFSIMVMGSDVEETLEITILPKS